MSSFLAAERAGIQPNTIPINVETPTAMSTELRLTALLI